MKLCETCFQHWLCDDDGDACSSCLSDRALRAADMAEKMRDTARRTEGIDRMLRRAPSPRIGAYLTRASKLDAVAQMWASRAQAARRRQDDEAGEDYAASRERWRARAERVEELLAEHEPSLLVRWHLDGLAFARDVALGRVTLPESMHAAMVADRHARMEARLANEGPPTQRDPSPWWQRAPIVTVTRTTP